ncbi:MAG: porin family protein [Gemmatimonadota bacterium]|nr:porin family protein [Gemmatimonadota bacterium]
MIKRILAGCALSAVIVTSAAAQQRQLPAELGIDAGISIGFDTPRATVVSVPQPAIRIGFFMTDRVSIEPRVGFQSIHDDLGTLSQYRAEVGLLLHAENNPIGRGLYARPFVGLVGTSGGGSSDTQTFLGAGMGLNVPFSNRFASRLEVNYSHMTAPAGGSAANSLGVLFGLSVFNR